LISESYGLCSDSKWVNRADFLLRPRFREIRLEYPKEIVGAYETILKMYDEIKAEGKTETKTMIRFRDKVNSYIQCLKIIYNRNGI
jgi:hypothetical protein